ncbi:MAG: hypothetical protein ACKKL6_02970 [Candidatus Komeilibacteria bacterium]
MVNDKGFSQIMSVVIGIVIIVLIGVVVSISLKDGEEIQTVDIITTEEVVNENKPEIGNVSFVGLDLSAGGYKLASQELNKDIQTISEVVEGKYSLLSTNIQQDAVFLIKDFWQDKDAGGTELYELYLETGDVAEIFSLPNKEVNNQRKFITGAVYSLDKSKIAYSTNLYSDESLELLEGGSKSVEIWEYDTVKDIHTLVADVSGGIYSGLKILGYDNSQENLILYQFNADAGASVLGRVQFLNIAEGVIDKDSFQLALDNYFSQVDEENKIKTAGYPYLSPSGEYIAFILPKMSWEDEMNGDNNEVVLYNISLHKIKSIYIDDLSAISAPSLNNLYWLDNYLYIPTNQKLVMYSTVADKIIPIYVWSDISLVNKLYAVTDNSAIIGVDGRPPVFIDFNKASETELVDMNNYEYINIYYK